MKILQAIWDWTQQTGPMTPTEFRWGLLIFGGIGILILIAYILDPPPKINPPKE